MQSITGTWHMVVRGGRDHETDWDNLPKVEFRDGRITLEDGSHPDFTNKRGVLLFSYPLRDAPPERRYVNIIIDRGSDGHLQGWRYLADRPVRRLPNPSKELPDGDRFARIELLRDDRFPDYRTQHEKCAAAFKRMLAEIVDEADAQTPTIH